MGLEELLQSLKKNEKKQIGTIWQQAETEADSIRKQVAEAIADVSKIHADQLASACQRSMRSIFSEAEVNVRRKKLYAYQSIDETLRDAAVKQLTALRQHNYENVFANLVAELPDRKWEKVIVNPQDEDLAAAFFARNTIRTDPNISGGLIVLTSAGKIIVDNTFEKRLERRWLHILPAVIEDIERKYDK